MTPPLCPHGRAYFGCVTCIVPDDAAKRAFDNIKDLAVHIPLDVKTQGTPWVALRLSDGGTDGAMYESRKLAIKYQVHEQQCAYFSFRGAPDGFANIKEAAIFLAWNRAAYDAGFRMPDPDDTMQGELAMPSSKEHIQNQLTRLLTAPRSYIPNRADRRRNRGR